MSDTNAPICKTCRRIESECTCSRNMKHAWSITPLEFGLNHGAPETPTAWGARLIIEQQGHTDLLHDRQDSYGPEKEKLVRYLNTHVLTRLLTVILPKALKDNTLKVDGKDCATFFKDSVVEVRGNPNGSYGYLYVRAWFRKDAESLTT